MALDSIINALVSKFRDIVIEILCLHRKVNGREQWKKVKKKKKITAVLKVVKKINPLKHKHVKQNNFRSEIK